MYGRQYFHLCDEEEIFSLFVKHLNTNLLLLATVLRDEQSRRGEHNLRDIDFGANSTSPVTHPIWT
jgi:hypothetical protein